MIGEIIDGKYLCERILAAAKSSAIFAASIKDGTGAQSGEKLVSVQIEKDVNDNERFTKEAEVLITMSGNQHFAKYFSCGVWKEYNYLATELLGPCLSDLARRRASGKLDLFHILKFGYQAFEAFQSLHRTGLMHSAVTADCFSIGSNAKTAGIVYLVDFKQMKKINSLVDQDNQQNNSPKSPKIDPQISMQNNLNSNVRYKPEDDLIQLVYVMAENCENPVFNV
ncbi:MAG: hypothetical protein EZS28_002440 [Streblomastix strix]|uniref:Protein kinase domain-containing protein n=1 Tax=Streblomastix strix TaxID=222440 RepID=A0A5J4X478_9EUKA|nr:MAG: hypothetical protein EZS28_002440 [Streblomastix strix]